jgi:hypothetical protein
MVAWLDHWQTLIGSAVGALTGVAGALIVAWNATRRERRIAAGALLPELMSFRAAQENLTDIARSSAMPKSEVLKATCRNLERLRPAAIVLHSPALGQLSDIHAGLYSHLYQCQMIHRHFESALAEFKQADSAAFAADLNPTDANFGQVEGEIQWKARRVKNDWDVVAEHATLANYFLDRFIFRRWPVWAYQLRMRYFPNGADRRSAHLLKTGALLVETESALPGDAV